MCWLSPTWGVARLEREAVGRDGERYAWARLQVVEFRDGRLASLCRFEVDDEDAAFAYAEEKVRAASNRLAVTNRSCATVHAMNTAMQSRDIDGVVQCCSDLLVYDDRRRLGGDPIYGRAALQTAFERILEQYSRFEWRILAVRGDRLNLNWSCWSDDAGNQTAYLHVLEIDENGLQIYEGRFDEDDFEGAYRELDRRYYAGEGAAFAAGGAVSTAWMTALSRGDMDSVGELSAPELRVENRSRTGFPDRSAREFRSSMEELNAMVGSARIWMSAICWLSPSWCVTRAEREAIGPDGEHYAWTFLTASEVRDGRLSSTCEFDVEDEEQAFACVQERMRAADTPLV
jgi:ketosteroid isomerase-like protein